MITDMDNPIYEEPVPIYESVLTLEKDVKPDSYHTLPKKVRPSTVQNGILKQSEKVPTSALGNCDGKQSEKVTKSEIEHVYQTQDSIKRRDKRRRGLSAKCLFLLVTFFMAFAFSSILGVLLWRCLMSKSGSPCYPNPCNGTQNCLERGEDFTCIPQFNPIRQMCQDLTTGGFCSANPCLNSGKCYENDENFTCVCQTGTSGRLCEIDTVAGPCSRNHCLNGGECYEQSQKFMCVCPYGFTGLLCDEIISEDPCSPNPCLNSGNCYGNGENFTCVCKTGSTGRLCDQDTWTPTVSGCIKGHNEFYVALETFNVAACKAVCDTFLGFQCCSFDYLPETGRCYLSNETSQTVPASYTTPCYDGKNVLIAERQVQGCSPG